ncbi:MAG: hypothetical protein OXD43_14105 [Bacteroidetes bacterium]|nr:hypothetical protein [Bacteroidota bacterium]
MTYHPDAVGKVTLEGKPLEHDARVPIPEGAELGIEGVGTLTVNPDQRVDNASLEAAEKRFRRLLLKHAVDDIAGARLSMQRRLDAEKRRRKAEALLRSVAPQGVDALRKKLAILPKKTEEEGDDEPTRAQASAEEENARTNRDACVETHERQRTRCAAAERKEATTAAALDGAQSRLSRAQVAIRGRDLSEEAARRQEKLLESLSIELQDLTLCRRELEDGAPDSEAVANRLARAKSVLDRAGDEKVRLRIEIAKLDESIKIQDGDAVEEELEDIAEQLEHAEEELRNIRHEVKVLQRLARALDDAQQSARDRYVAPVLEELRPLIGLLWPRAQISFGAENILPETLERHGTKEDFSVLSGGTQEQIAILVRLAFARILANSGSPAPVIFDDAIVYTDDYRIESMFDALTRQAQDHQIIVLSCRQRAFMDLGGIGLSIKAVTATG